jgi:hypothetical protein
MGSLIRVQCRVAARGRGRQGGDGAGVGHRGLADEGHVEVGWASQKSRSDSMYALTLVIWERASASSSNTPISMPL